MVSYSSLFLQYFYAGLGPVSCTVGHGKLKILMLCRLNVNIELLLTCFHARYSYDYGLVHFIMMSTEHDMGNGSRQYAWLEKDLQNVDRVKTPWVILAGHRPMYTSELPIGKVKLFNFTQSFTECKPLLRLIASIF